MTSKSEGLCSVVIAFLCCAALLGLDGCGISSTTSPSGRNSQVNADSAAAIKGEDSQPASSNSAAAIGHVFVIILENKGYANTFASNSLAPYLAQTLPKQGALVQNYYGVGHVSLDNYIAMISGQGPNPITQSDCQIFQEFAGSTPISALDGQAPGVGCVYPASVPNITDQMKSKLVTWRGYMESMGNVLTRESATCGHPAINSQDPTQTATAQDSYATRHNPFVYFHSVIDNQSYCDAHVVNLKQLETDLSSAAMTPQFTFITPDLCHDGHDAPCANGDAGGLKSVNDFLMIWVPKILASPAYQQDGLLIITFDESDGPQSDASACCAPTGPSVNSPLPGITGLGGGKVGAVMLSTFIRPGTVSTTNYNHYSMLRTLEDIYGLSYLGYAGASGSQSFGSDIFTQKIPKFPPKN